MSLHATMKVVGDRAAAHEAQVPLSDKDKINLALRELLNITDPDAGALLRFAANQLAAHGDKLLRVKFEQECGL